MKKVVVIGAGASGLMAAGVAASCGKSVVLIEKNERIGKKLLITGKGRCNITNSEPDIKELISNFPRNGKFLFSALSRFSNLDIIEFFENLGLQTKIERGQRVFPASDKAADVVEALKKFINKNKVDLLCDSQVAKILTIENIVAGVVLKNGKTINCEAVIICTGGKSYPKTGSNGDGYKMAKDLGHTVTDLKASLVPLNVKESWVKELEGLSLKNVSVKFTNSKNKTLFSDFGEMIFTAKGVSGPLILSASAHLPEEKLEGMLLSIDLKPALTLEKLDERILRDFEKYSRKCFKNSLDDLLPRKMIETFISLSGVDPMKHTNQISKEERKHIALLLKNFTFTIVSLGPIEEAIVTRGGIDISQVNPQTMESKIVKGLFFAGEILDVDGYTGGFNLTIAFSTAHLAGNSIC